MPALGITGHRTYSGSPVDSTNEQVAGGGFNVVYNTGALSGGPSMIAMIAIGAGALVVVYLLARR